MDLSAADQVVVTAEKDDVTQQFNARFLVDASGQSTFLARHLKSKKPFTSMQPRVAYSTHWKDANLTTDINAGNIKIATGQLAVRDGAEINTLTSVSGSGKGWDINIFATESVTITGTSVAFTSERSELIAQTQ